MPREGALAVRISRRQQGSLTRDSYWKKKEETTFPHGNLPERMRPWGRAAVESNPKLVEQLRG